jgi:hypothetical protein
LFSKEDAEHDAFLAYLTPEGMTSVSAQAAGEDRAQTQGAAEAAGEPGLATAAEAVKEPTEPFGCASPKVTVLLEALVKEFQDAIVEELPDAQALLGRTATAMIRLKGDWDQVPRHKRHYKLSTVELTQLKAQLEELLAK